MLKYFLAISLLSAGFMACGNSQEQEVSAGDSVESVSVDNAQQKQSEVDTGFAPSDSVGAEHTASTAIDFAGTYAGVLPCEDCKGIETTLMLKEDKQYILLKKYLGKSDEAYSTSGAWQWLNGNVMRLSSSQGVPTLIHISENKVMMLDASGNHISGELADKYNLKKVQ